MSEVLVVKNPDGAIRSDAVDVSVICSNYMRERCVELLRERACELGSRSVVIRSEKYAPIASGNRKGVRDLELQAWIIRQPSQL